MQDVNAVKAYLESLLESPGRVINKVSPWGGHTYYEVVKDPKAVDDLGPPKTITEDRAGREGGESRVV
jgi:hypothetical protein